MFQLKYEVIVVWKNSVNNGQPLYAVAPGRLLTAVPLESGTPESPIDQRDRSSRQDFAQARHSHVFILCDVI